MKSNVCRIEKGTKDLDAILRESEKVAVYNELDHKQTLQLRLICEEIDGMLPNIIDEFGGDLWIEFENGVCKVNLSIKFEEFSADKKKELVKISKDKKNAAAVGIVGKIRSAIENFFLDQSFAESFGMSAHSFNMATSYCRAEDYSYFWTLDQYKASVKNEEKGEKWDELEKSVLAAVADDVIVGVKGKEADIIIVKKFA